MKKNIIIILFFVLYLILGLSIYKDYGASWDETHQRDMGVKAYNYVVNGSDEYLTLSNRFYGPVFQIFAMFIEKACHPETMQDIFFLRHLLVFLIFYTGLIFFYLFLYKRFGDWRLALLGCFFMILSPRIFGHTFYNPKDIPFLALFMAAAYALVLFIEKMTLPRVFFLSVISALCISMRIIGGFVPVFVIFSCLMYKLTVDRKRLLDAHFFILIPAYFIFMVPIVIITWPVLWEAPLERFIEALSNLKTLEWYSIPVLYMGQKIVPSNVPWHYTPVWMLITIPVTYTIFFLVGIFVFFKKIVRPVSSWVKSDIIDLFCFVWFVVPLILPMVLHSPLFSSWRHHYFIYPAFLTFALSGFLRLKEWFKSSADIKKRVILSATAALLIALDLGAVAGFMIRNHPYEDMYFNDLIGGIKGAEGKFELDYWGISYKKALEYIGDTDNSAVVDILAANFAAKVNAFILPFELSSRLNVVVAEIEPLIPKYTYHFGNAWEAKDARYYVSNFYGTYYRLPFPLYYSVTVDGVSILDVYYSK